MRISVNYFIIFPIILVIAAQCFANCGRDSEHANGYNDKILWCTDLEGAKRFAMSTKKPIMLVIHQSWCEACKKLESEFVDSIEIEKLSEKFVMVNLDTIHAPLGDEFKPDGEYIPRIFFLSSEGEVHVDVINVNGYNSYKYFYYHDEDILKAMKVVLGENSNLQSGEIHSEL